MLIKEGSQEKWGGMGEQGKAGEEARRRGQGDLAGAGRVSPHPSCPPRWACRLGGTIRSQDVHVFLQHPTFSLDVEARAGYLDFLAHTSSVVTLVKGDRCCLPYRRAATSSAVLSSGSARNDGQSV